MRPIDDAFEVSDDAPNALAQLEGGEAHRRLMDCLGDLEPRHAAAIRAAFLDGASYEGLAQRVENKDKLVKILTYHVVKANALSDAISKMIKDDGGKHTIKTVSGGTLVAMMKGDKLVLHDETEGTATVTIANVKQSNGVIHVIDHVLLPK